MKLTQFISGEINLEKDRSRCWLKVLASSLMVFATSVAGKHDGV
jgi:hypothetical protein